MAGASPHGVGTLLAGVVGAPLRATSEGAPYTRVRGGPALVVEVAERRGSSRRRVLTADGMLGWLDGSFVGMPGALLISNDITVTDRIVAANTANDEVVERPIMAGSKARVLRASDAAYPETMMQLGAGSALENDWWPWLYIAAGDTQGWLAPGNTHLAWSAPASGDCFSWQGFEGLVREPFLAGATAALAALAPRSGEPIRYVVRGATESWPDAASCSAASAAVFAVKSAAPLAVLFHCSHHEFGKVEVLATAGPQRRFFVMDEERTTRVISAEVVDFDAAPATLMLELGLQSSHDEEHGLLAPNLPHDLNADDVIALDGDEVIGTWSANSASKSVAVVQTSSSGTTTYLLKDRRGHLVKTEGHTVVLSQHTKLLDAQRAVLQDPGSQVIALGYPVRLWGRARSYPTQAEACQRLAAEGTASSVRQLRLNRPCGLGK